MPGFAELAACNTLAITIAQEPWPQLCKHSRTSVKIYVPELAPVALLIANAARLVGVALAKTALII